MNKNIIIISLVSIILLSANVSSAYNIPAGVSSKVCSVTTKACVSNVTNPLTVKDEELLQACKDCCSLSQVNAPSSIKSNIKGCIPRCQKGCAKAYKKEIAKLGKNK